MSLAGITSLASSPGSIGSTFNATRKQDSNQLFSALEKGDLSGAQAAYSQLAALNDKGSGGPYVGPKLSSDFAAVGQALQKGDLTGAQEAALQFGQDLLAANQKIQGGKSNTQQSPSVIVNLSGLIDQVNPNNVAATPVAASSSPISSSTAPAASTAAPTPSTSTSGSGSSSASATSNGAAPEIVINLGGPNGSTLDLNVNGSEIEISLANGTAGSNSPSTIDLNFGGGTATGSPIQINFGNSNSSGASQASGISIIA